LSPFSSTVSARLTSSVLSALLVFKVSTSVFSALLLTIACKSWTSEALAFESTIAPKLSTLA
jgi:hypothetical protein